MRDECHLESMSENCRNFGSRRREEADFLPKSHVCPPPHVGGYHSSDTLFRKLATNSEGNDWQGYGSKSGPGGPVRPRFSHNGVGVLSYGLGAGLHVELFVDAANVGIHGVNAYVQPVGDFLEKEALR